jgi:ABC-type nitrate/sulfonate/bicarbonate transport system permease component
MTADKKHKTKKKKKNIMTTIAPLLLLVFIVLFLDFIIRAAGINRIVLPTPAEVVRLTADALVKDLWFHFTFNVKVIFVGMLAAVTLGMLLAAIASQVKLIVQAITPVVVLLVVTPMITLIPLMQLWLGSNPNIRILVVMVSCTPIIMLNTLTGFTNIETSKLELAKSMGASKMQIFAKVIFPNAMPQVFTGIKLGCIFSTIGSVTADFVYGMQGLGFKIQQYTKYVMTEQIYGSIILIAIIGFVLYKIVAMIERKVVIWKL